MALVAPNVKRWLKSSCLGPEIGPFFSEDFMKFNWYGRLTDPGFPVVIALQTTLPVQGNPNVKES
jgi:hypothetical protein